jgi:DNA polymerase III sliding clamp (beta) subunit (PCNA family)
MRELFLTFEEGTWSAWLYDLLTPYVTKIVVCDPRRNALLKEGNANDRTHGVRFALDKDHLEVSASSPEYGEAKEFIETQYDQEAVQIGFNAQYLLDFLRAATGAISIRMQVKDAESAVEFRPCGDHCGQDQYVLMPLRF